LLLVLIFVLDAVEKRLCRSVQLNRHYQVVQLVAYSEYKRTSVPFVSQKCAKQNDCDCNEVYIAEKERLFMYAPAIWEPVR
jgi:hypothetical protein